jgi:hypothetical protein
VRGVPTTKLDERSPDTDPVLVDHPTGDLEWQRLPLSLVACRIRSLLGCSCGLDREPTDGTGVGKPQ